MVLSVWFYLEGLMMKESVSLPYQGQSSGADRLLLSHAHFLRTGGLKHPQVRTCAR